MKLHVRCASGLRVDFEGSIEELERFDGFLAELARIERGRLVPAEGPPNVIALAEPKQADKPAAVTRKPRTGGRDGLTDKQQALLSAVNSLGECTVAQVCEYVDRHGEGAAVSDALKHLRDRGLITHNGKLAKAARWLRIEPLGTQRQAVEDRSREVAKPSGLTGSIEERIELALKWAKRPMSLDGLVSRCNADGERSRVQEALAYMEADGRAVMDERGLWSRAEPQEQAA